MKRHISILKHMLEDITDINEFTEGVDFDTFVTLESFIRLTLKNDS